MFVAIPVLFLGTLAATFVADIVRGATATARVGSPSIFAGVARWAIIGFAALIALEQLQIAPALINVLFTAIVGAVAIAFGLAFGLGGQETVRRWLARSENTVTDAAARIQAQQSTDFYSTPNCHLHGIDYLHWPFTCLPRSTLAQRCHGRLPLRRTLVRRPHGTLSAH